MKRKIIFTYATAAFLLLLFITPASPQNQETRKKEIEQILTSWLVLGPIPTPLPAFHKDEKKGFSVDELLKFEELDISSLKPKADAPFTLHYGSAVHWKKIDVGAKGVVLEGNTATPSIAYLGAYIDAARWTLAKIAVTCPHPLKVYLDGKLVAEKSRTEKNQEGTASGNLILETGKHLLLIKTLSDPDENSNWTVNATLSYNESYNIPAPVVSLSDE
jgi:hypothetical protein